MFSIISILSLLATARAAPALVDNLNSRARIPESFEVGLAISLLTGSLVPLTEGGSRLGWYHNWKMEPSLDQAPNDLGLNYVPMVWGAGQVGDVKEASKKWDHVTHVMSFYQRQYHTIKL